MRATWLADVFRDAGLVVRPYSGWETRGASTLDPRGVILHHTVTRPTASDAAVDRVLAVVGSSKVPPPLANYSTNRDGSVSIICAGVANHGGQGNWKGISGNRFFLGDEMKNHGTQALEPWSARQVESALIAAAAVCRHIGRDASWVCGHKEYATPKGRKPDPHTLDMNELRAVVARLLGATPTIPGGSDMAWKPGDPETEIKTIADADRAFAEQGTFFAGQNVATYLKGVSDPLFREGIILGFARITAKLIEHDKRIRAEEAEPGGGGVTVVDLDEAKIQTIVNQSIAGTRLNPPG